MAHTAVATVANMSASSTALDLQRHFGIPRAWFLSEAKAGRLPCLRAGNRILFNLEAVDAALSRRAAAGSTPPSIIRPMFSTFSGRIFGGENDA